MNFGRRKTLILVLIKLFNVLIEIDAEEICALPQATKCFSPIHQILDCEENLQETGFCIFENIFNWEKNNVTAFCTIAEDILNSCFKDLIGNAACSASHSHSFYEKNWLPSLNSFLTKFCKYKYFFSNDYELCQYEPTFDCLKLKFQQKSDFHLIQTITKKIHPEICGSIEINTHFCLNQPKQSEFVKCRPSLNIIKNLIEEFVIDVNCSSFEHFYLIPFNNDITEINESAEIDENDDHECELDSFILTSCFSSMKSNWDDFLLNRNFSLEQLCLSINEGVETCLVNLIGYGCENDQRNEMKNQLENWLPIFRHFYGNFCNDKILENQKMYFQNETKSCWNDFFKCTDFNSEKFVYQLLNENSVELCNEFVDTSMTCMLPTNLEKHEDKCGFLSEKLRILYEAPICSIMEVEYVFGSGNQLTLTAVCLTLTTVPFFLL